MNCTECGKSSKYKCPTCREPYCSVACCKQHKAALCTPPQQVKEIPKEETLITYEFPTEDTVPPERLKLLDSSKDLKKCLENPHVREILKLLDASPHPDTLINVYMREPIFTEFVDACLNVVQDKSDN